MHVFFYSILYVMYAPHSYIGVKKTVIMHDSNGGYREFLYALIVLRDVYCLVLRIEINGYFMYAYGLWPLGIIIT